MIEQRPVGDDKYSEWGAAYVLGSLSPSDRREFDTHIGGCAKCSTSVAEIAGMPGLLAMVPREHALADTAAHEDAAQPAPIVLINLATAVRRRRQKQRVAFLIAAAVAAVGISIPTAALLSDNASRPTSEAVSSTSRVMKAVIPSTLIASASVTPTPWGSSIVIDCSYSAPVPGDTRYGTTAEEYALSVTDASGIVTTLATWTGRPGETVRPTASTSQTPGSLRSIQVRATDSDQILLTTPI